MTDMISVVPQSLGTLLVGLDAALDYGQANDATQWTISPVSDTMTTTVTQVTYNQGSTAAVVHLAIPMTAQAVYSLSYGGVDDQGVALGVAALSGTAPNDSKSLNSHGAGDFYHGLLRAITDSLGQSCQEQHGRPATRLLADFDPEDSHMLVESTLAFPTDGIVILDGQRFKYSGKETNRLNNAVNITSYAYKMTAPFLGEWGYTRGGVQISAHARKEVVLDVATNLPD